MGSKQCVLDINITPVSLSL